MRTLAMPSEKSMNMTIPNLARTLASASCSSQSRRGGVDSGQQAGSVTDAPVGNEVAIHAWEAGQELRGSGMQMDVGRVSQGSVEAAVPPEESRTGGALPHSFLHSPH